MDDEISDKDEAENCEGFGLEEDEVDDEAIKEEDENFLECFYNVEEFEGFKVDDEATDIDDLADNEDLKVDEDDNAYEAKSCDGAAEIEDTCNNGSILILSEFIFSIFKIDDVEYGILFLCIAVYMDEASNEWFNVLLFISLDFLNSLDCLDCFDSLVKILKCQLIYLWMNSICIDL